MVKITDDSTKSGLKDKRELDQSALTKILVNAGKTSKRSPDGSTVFKITT